MKLPKHIVKLMEWYLENQSRDGEASTRELLDYIKQENIQVDMKLNPHKVGRILSDSKQFIYLKKWVKRYNRVLPVWRVKPK